MITLKLLPFEKLEDLIDENNDDLLSITNSDLNEFNSECKEMFEYFRYEGEMTEKKLIIYILIFRIRNNSMQRTDIHCQISVRMLQLLSRQ